MKPPKTYIVLLLFTSIQLVSTAQQVTDVVTEQVGQQIMVHYTLGGEGGKVGLYVSEDGGNTWQGPLEKVSGDVGPGQRPGSNKTITWDVLAEREKLVGDWVFGIQVEVADDLRGSASIIPGANVFTPNGDGENDVLYVDNELGGKGDALEAIHFKIFNRWGEVIFEATDISQIVYPNGGWDGNHMKTGKEMEVGVYVWLLEATTVRGEVVGPISGNVTLIR